MSNHRAFIVLVSFVFLACGAKVDGSSNSAGPPASDSTATGSPSSGTSTSGAANSWGDRCFGQPQCDLGDLELLSQSDACVEAEGTTCYERKACEGNLWCRHYDEKLCKGFRSCDSAQAEVKTCPAGAECVVKTTCGRSILCQKLDPDCEAELPKCQLGESQYAGSANCRAGWTGRPTKECFTRANACGFTVWCQPF